MVKEGGAWIWEGGAWEEERKEKAAGNGTILIILIN